MHHDSASRALPAWLGRPVHGLSGKVGTSCAQAVSLLGCTVDTLAWWSVIRTAAARKPWTPCVGCVAMAVCVVQM